MNEVARNWFMDGTILPMLTTPGAEREIPLKMPPALAFFVGAPLVAFELRLGAMCAVEEQWIVGLRD
jgi:hypothetical protein